MNFFDISLNIYRKKWGTAFRKRLGVFNYKIGHQGYHKQPGAIPLHVK
jgi:large subunit ribosomal protein L41